MVVLNLDNSDARRVVESCYRTHKTLINPIIDWDDEFLWWYIRKEQIIINPQYKNGCPGGCSRIGCIGCPMGGNKRWKEFEQYPKYKEAYIRAFDKMLEARKIHGNKYIPGWDSGKKVFRWWMEDKNYDGQLGFDVDGNIFEDYI